MNPSAAINNLIVERNGRASSNVQCLQATLFEVIDNSPTPMASFDAQRLPGFRLFRTTGTVVFHADRTVYNFATVGSTVRFENRSIEIKLSNRFQLFNAGPVRFCISESIDLLVRVPLIRGIKPSAVIVSVGTKIALYDTEERTSFFLAGNTSVLNNLLSSTDARQSFLVMCLWLLMHTWDPFGAC